MNISFLDVCSFLRKLEIGEINARISFDSRNDFSFSSGVDLNLANYYFLSLENDSRRQTTISSRFSSLAINLFLYWQRLYPPLYQQSLRHRSCKLISIVIFIRFSKSIKRSLRSRLDSLPISSQDVPRRCITRFCFGSSPRILSFARYIFLIKFLNTLERI